ncbi:MAG TPA: metalloregulator ArsR/SmtB family transcription factor [Steroidobacteraceae bacterium]|nr:metalloregulator ArsR/SmtB family transcription factor [Steroidobacteraceae bacterium]
MANIAAIFVALADPSRREIFERVARSPCAVGELADALPISRPAVSQHLKVLKDAGLLKSESQGTRNVYYLDAQGIVAMRKYLDGFWGGALESFKAVAERKRK